VTPFTSFPKPYFLISVASYVIGLSTTIAVMHTFQRAQPALLYLSPACTLGPVLLALSRAELSDLWKWSDAPVDTKEKKLDDTIEPPSEAAARARQAVEDNKAEEVAEQVAEHVEKEDQAAKDEKDDQEDESWMDGPSSTPGKPRKRKGGKKK